MILERILADYLTARMVGLMAFKDDLAFSLNPVFPYLLTNQISRKRESLGAGFRDFISDQGTTKIYVDAVSIRFTFRAVSTEAENGNDIVAAQVKQADQILGNLTRTGGISLRDSVTKLPQRIVQGEYLSQSDIQPITDRLPVVYQKALSYSFRIIVPFAYPEGIYPMTELKTHF